MSYSFSGILLITDSDEIIAMHRDDKPGVRDAGCYGIFGGAAEENETPLQTAVRELKEETNLRPTASAFAFFRSYTQQRDNLPEPSKLHVFVVRHVDPKTLKTFEGQGIKLLQTADDPKIALDIRIAFEDWFREHPAKSLL